jgi:hypothetical protein
MAGDIETRATPQNPMTSLTHTDRAGADPRTHYRRAVPAIDLGLSYGISVAFLMKRGARRERMRLWSPDCRIGGVAQASDALKIENRQVTSKQRRRLVARSSQ